MTDLFTERDKKKAKAFVKGANTGIAQILGFPVDMVNMAPLLLNLLPGKQGMQPFSGKPVGGSQTFKDLMAAGNVGTYKDIASIPKDEYEAGILGMLSSEALTSLIPISQLVKGLPRGSKTVLPQPTATGVDLSRRDLFKKAGAAAVATAVSPSIIKGIGDLVPPAPAAKVAKVGLKGALGSAVAKAQKLRDLYFGANKVIKEGSSSPMEAVDSLSQSMKIGEEMDSVTLSMNKDLDKVLKDAGDFSKFSDDELIALAELKLDIVHMMRTGKGPNDFVRSGDPLRRKDVSKALDEAINARGLREQLRDIGLERTMQAIEGKRSSKPSADMSGINLPSDIIPKMLPSSGQATKSIFAPEAKKGRQLLIVSCGDKKCPDVGNMKALDRYLGPIFTSIRKAGVPENVDVAILSAKHGLIRADTPIENYDQLMTKDKVSDFISNPDEMSKIAETMRGYDNILVQGGDNYKSVIKSAAGDIPFTEVPKGRGIGDQRSFVAKFLEDQAKVNRAKPTDLAFHYSSYTDDQIKNFDIKKIEQRQLGSYETAGEAKMDSDGIADTTFESILGLHVGTPKAAHDRALRTNYVGFFTKQSEKVRYELPDDEFIKNEDIIPMGSYYSLDIDTSKPYTNPKDELGIWSEGDLEDHIIKILDKDPVVADLLEKQKKASGDEFFSILEKRQQAEMKAFRKFRKSLAEQGFTNVPYYNRMEDPGSISQIMLIDRPKGDKVIKSKITSEPMAQGGVAGLSDMARDMFKGPKGIGAYQPFMVG